MQIRIQTLDDFNLIKDLNKTSGVTCSKFKFKFHSDMNHLSLRWEYTCSMSVIKLTRTTEQTPREIITPAAFVCDFIRT